MYYLLYHLVRGEKLQAKANLRDIGGNTTQIPGVSDKILTPETKVFVVCCEFIIPLQVNIVIGYMVLFTS